MSAAIATEKRERLSTSLYVRFHHDPYIAGKRPRRTGSNNCELHSGIPNIVTTISGEPFPYNTNDSNVHRERTDFYFSDRGRNDRYCCYHRLRALRV